MANVKISGLTAYTDPVATDVLPIVDLVNDQTKKVKVEDLLKKFGLGTEALPSFAFTGDLDTGIYSPGANQFAVTTGGTQRLLIDASGNTTIQGDLTVNGTTTTVSSNTLSIKDKNIEIAVVSTPTDTTADGGGITLKGATDKTLTWVNSTDCWTFNQALNLTAGTAGAPALVFNGDVNSGLFQPGADSLAIATAGTQRVTVDSSGKVGIGTTSPTRQLEIAAAGTSIVRVRDTSNSVNMEMLASSAGGWIGPQSAHSLNFQTGNTERMRIDASGRLGLGTSSPTTKLHVAGDVKVVNTGIAYLQPNTVTAFQAYESSGPVKISLTNNGGATFAGGAFAIASDGDISTNVRCHGSIELDSTGSFSSPKIKLFSNTGNATFLGNVGVGTTSPSSKLEVKRTDAAGNYFYAGASSDNGIRGLQFSSSDNGVYLGAAHKIDATSSGGSIALATGGNERLRIDSSGVIKHTGSTGADEANKLARYVVPSHDTNEEDVMVFQVENESSFNQLTFGGGTSSYNAVTQIIFRTASAVDTTTGSERMRISSDGDLFIGGTSDANADFVFDSGSRASFYRTLYFGGATSAAATIELNTNGTAYFASNVGIGITSPQTRFHSSGTTNGAQATFGIASSGLKISTFQKTGNDAGVILDAQESTNGTLAFNTRGSERMRIDSSGRLLLGTTTAATNSELTVRATSPHLSLYATPGNDSRLNMGDTDNHDIGLIAYANSDNSMRFTTNATERMRLANNGILFLVTDNNTCQINSTTVGAGTANAIFIGRHSGTAGVPDSGTASIYIYTNGNVQNTNNSYGAISDIKLKENIVDANSQWNDLKAIQVRNYNFIEGQTHTQIGVVAQEVETVSPGLVSESLDRDEEGTDLGTVTKSVNYSVLYMKAVKALQEAMTRIETLEQRLSDAGIA